MSDSIAFLIELMGLWEGEGVNHEGQAYRGRMVVEPPMNQAAMLVRFVATGLDGAAYHREVLMAGLTAEGEEVAFSISNNLPGIVRFEMARPAPNHVVFTFGRLENNDSFREVITIRRDADGGIFHGFAWAMPGEAMQERSSARLVFIHDGASTP
jgi:hypothetical protein